MKIRKTREVVDDFYIDDEDVVNILDYYRSVALHLDSSEWIRTNNTGNLAIYEEDHYGHDLQVRELTTDEVEYFNASILVRNFIKEKFGQTK